VGAGRDDLTASPEVADGPLSGCPPLSGSRPLSASPPVSASGPLSATRDAPVGGQAVLEGVMMRGVSSWAVAVRKAVSGERGAGAERADEAGAIEVQSFPLAALTKRRRAFRWPLVRGVVALVESLTIGLRALGISANAHLAEEEQQQIGSGVWAGTLILALAFAVGLFFVVPVGLTSLVKHQLGSAVAFWLVEGVLRTAIFLGYLVLLSRIRDLARVLQYHGAEHKVISCFEADDELVPARAALYSRLHPRCGTSFLLVVMIVAIFVFAPIGLPAWWVLVLTRILGVPLIAGISFEVIKWAGRNRRRGWVKALMWPGLQLQKLTTREPDLPQLEVAIAALRAVLDVEGTSVARGELVGLEVVA